MLFQPCPMMSVCSSGDCGGVFRFKCSSAKSARPDQVPVIGARRTTSSPRRLRVGGSFSLLSQHWQCGAVSVCAFLYLVGYWLESALHAGGVRGKRKETNSELSPVNSIIAARSTALPNPIHPFPGWCGTQTCQITTWCFSSSLFVLIHIDVVYHMHVSIGRSHMLTSVGG